MQEKIISNGWEYLIENNAAYIIGTDNIDNEHIVIPEKLDEKAVEILWFGVVSSETKSISIPKTVKEIKMWGYPISLEEILVDENNQYFSSRDGVLYNKDGTKLVRFPCAKNYKNSALNGVVEILDMAFEDVQNINGVVIPDSVIKIGEEAFCWCETLTSIKMSNSVNCIGAGAFCGCPLVKIEITDNIFKYEMSDYDEGLGFFCGCEFEEFIVPDNIKEIGDKTFENCKKMRKVCIPASVETIGEFVFHGCDSLEEIIVSDNNANYYSKDGVLYDKGGTLLHYPQNKDATTYEVSSDITSIGSYAFYESRKLKTLKLGANVSILGYRAFACSHIESVNIPSKVSRIEQDVFLYTDIKELYIPKTVLFIEMSSDTAGNINPFRDMKIVVDANSYAAEVCKEKGLNITTI